MLISHESPLCLLEKSKEYNDYDYALVHLFEKYPAYFDFFKESIKTRKMYLDNSVFELGKAFDPDRFKKYCDIFAGINCDNFYYIVPDCLGDMEGTIEQFKSFDYNRGHRIGVVQGNTLDSVMECFKFMRSRADIVAVSFGYPFFLESPGSTVCEKCMNGRISLMDELKRIGLLQGVKVHLLGCYLPQEFRHYKDWEEIVSLDTSNPVVHGLKHIRYGDEGLTVKESVKLVDLIEVESFPDDVLYNIRKFRELTQ